MGDEVDVGYGIEWDGFFVDGYEGDGVGVGD